MDYYSLKELADQLENDVHLQGTMTVEVTISLERQHLYSKDGQGKPRLVLGPGYLVSLSLPARSASSMFSDGEHQMIGDLRYLGDEESTVVLEDVMKAFDIDADAKIWKIEPPR